MLRHRQRGMTLIEALVALLVISVGILGIGSLQAVALKQSSSSLNHSRAVWLGYEMADRIRANETSFANYAGVDSEKSYAQDCEAAACSSAEMVTADAAAWSENLQALPAGRGIIAGDATQLVVRIMWDDESTGASGTNCGSDPAVDLSCYRITLRP